MNTPSAHSGPQSLGRDDPAREAVLRAATAPLRAAVGDRVRVEVKVLNHIGPWVFLQGKMHGADGGRPDFSGSAYERPAAAGQMSDVYVALLRDVHEWQLLAHAIGPSDVAWENWSADHAAPRELFRFPVT